MPQAAAGRDRTSWAGPLTTVLGPVRTAADRSPAAAKARVSGREDRNGGSVNPNRGSTARIVLVHASYVPGSAWRGPWMTSMLASSAGLMVPRPAAAWVDGTQTSGSNSPKTIASSGAGNVSGPAVSQPRAASARRVPTSENSASSAVSSQTTSTSAATAAARSRAAAATAMDSGRSGSIAIRSRGRPRPATCRVRLTS
jgi:hypothetical protein